MEFVGQAIECLRGGVKGRCSAGNGQSGMASAVARDNGLV